MFSFSGLALAALESRNAVVDSASQLLSKRGSSDSDPSAWSGLFFTAIVLLNVAVFLPMILFLGYTLSELIPTIAIVEDDAPLDAPPAYERVALDDKSAHADIAKHDVAAEASEAGATPVLRPVTASLRDTCRLLRSLGGWTSVFRGLRIHVLANAAIALVTIALSCIPYLPVSVAVLFASLICVPLNTAWVHVAISSQASTSFWSRLSNAKTMYRAAALPTLVYYVAMQVVHMVSYLIAGSPKTLQGEDAPRGLLAVGVMVLLSVGLLVPAQVVLVRVQASLLPADDQTIVAVNRAVSAEGEQRGYMSTGEAWSSFSRASWVRLLKLYVKTIFVGVAIELMATSVILLEFGVIAVIGSMVNK
ncbi:Uu.00g067860.m01.CDS01 [Anthostomella pinea]|uniref:Uu.00g067860.m01.CDS01 n=1 Tax=Anthostomella pinea TaxID=933095 RepID=A0AAI8VU88_9PEZI|nr:Uu.00g067860.m01.CDS01 [Anthostomella pinea]